MESKALVSNLVPIFASVAIVQSIAQWRRAKERLDLRH